MTERLTQLRLIDVNVTTRKYHDSITASVNAKGCMDVDTVKGCTMGMADKEGGCYHECYAAKIANRYGIAFDHSVSRGFVDRWQHRDILVRQLRAHSLTWYRIGVMGDPSHDWDHTLAVIRNLRPAEKTAVVITKHWKTLTDDHLSQLLELDVVFNTSTSGLDTDAQTKHRVGQFERLAHYGIRSVNRVITCEYGDTEWAQERKHRQDYLLTLKPLIDNPLRVSPDNPRVLSGEIRVTRRHDSIGGGTLVSVNDPNAYLGHCSTCPDQCGALDAPLKGSETCAKR